MHRFFRIRPPCAERQPSRASQATPEGLQVALSSALVKLGEPVGIIVRVEGDRRVRFGPLPKVSGLSFSKVTQTGRQQSVSYDARGRPVVEQRTTFEVRVQPGEVGKYSIPPLSIELDEVVAAGSIIEREYALVGTSGSLTRSLEWR